MTREEIDTLWFKAMHESIASGEDFTRYLFAAFVISQHVKETRPEVAESMEEWLQQIAYQHGGIGDLSRTEMEFGAMVASAAAIRARGEK